MTGLFVGVVGPSGVGKDSVMVALAKADPQIALARRVITRPASAGGEEFDGVSDDAFLRRYDDGEFALYWQAHGLRYAIPASVDQALAEGRTVLANLSRSVLLAAGARFDKTVVIVLTAPVPVLAERLAARGREDEHEIAHRLKRADFALPDGLAPHMVDNTGPLAQTVAVIRQLLANAARCNS